MSEHYAAFLADFNETDCTSKNCQSKNRQKIASLRLLAYTLVVKHSLTKLVLVSFSNDIGVSYTRIDTLPNTKAESLLIPILCNYPLDQVFRDLIETLSLLGKEYKVRKLIIETLADSVKDCCLLDDTDDCVSEIQIAIEDLLD